MNPELPLLKWAGGWESEVVLPSWRGFQTRRGPYAAVSSDKPSDGSVRVRFRPDGAGKIPPTAAQVAAYKWLVEHEAAVAAAILAAVFAEYPQIREEYVYGCEHEDVQFAAQSVPPLDTPDQLKYVMGLHAAFVLPVAKDGVGYVGFEFGCAWEEEHGLGVMTHKDRIIVIRDAGDASNAYWAREDAVKE